MKRYLLVAVLVFSAVSPAHAWFGKNKNKNKGGNAGYTISQCAAELSQRTGGRSDLAQRACSNGKTDKLFIDCTVNFLNRSYSSAAFVAEAGYLCANNISGSNFTKNCVSELQMVFNSDPQYIPFTAGLCRSTQSDDFPQCVTELYRRGGQGAQTAASLCMNSTDKALNACIVSRFAQTRDAAGANSYCQNPANRAKGNAGTPLEPQQTAPADLNTSTAPAKQNSSFDINDFGSNDGGVIVDLPMPR